MVCQACGSPINGGAKFCGGCGRVVDERAYAAEQRRLTRPREGRMIAGVCIGIAQYFGWDPTGVRLAVCLVTFFGAGTPILAYVIAWVLMPESPYAVPVQASTPSDQEPGAKTS
jgi:phage shock protein C